MRFGGLMALNGVSMAVQPGEIRAIIGPNGAGKSTFFNCVTGVLRPTAGRIVFEGQDIAGKNFYRPRDAKAAAKYEKQFAPVKLFTIDEVFGGWAKAQKTHFDDGGVFDQIYASKS